MDNLCGKLHTLLQSGIRFDFSMGYNQIPDDGIYIMFEKGEVAHGGDRIVRIGTHTGDKQLTSRIFQHFENENKNRSIFRKNIGRAILNKEGSSYLNIWNFDPTTKQKKELYAPLIDRDFESALEKRISHYIQENLSFCILAVPTKKERLHYEARLIGTVSKCIDCHASEGWLGNYSPVEKIKKSGLWQVMELYSEPLTEDDLDFVAAILLKASKEG